MGQKNRRELRRSVKHPPEGFKKLAWYGPALLWMLSSVGSGSVLFTPRVGSRYGFQLLWIALIVIFMQWVMNREVGRYTVVTGRTLLDGCRNIPGPRGWAIWFIFIPQIFAAVVTIAGISALAGSALMIAFPGSQAVYASAIIIVSIFLVISGKYEGVERLSSILSGVLIISAIATAALVFDSPVQAVSGLKPGIPGDLDFYFILPWLGFILAGAAGILWFSYWISFRGFGGDVVGKGNEQGEQEEYIEEQTDRKKIKQIKEWDKITAVTAAIGVIGGGIVVLSFLTLGAEVLRPQGIVPKGIDVARDLTNLFSQTWGQLGFWILILGIFIALWGTVLADQDGWGRTFADATILLSSQKNRKKKDLHQEGFFSSFLSDRERLKNYYALIFTAVLPLIVFFFARDPVSILTIGGIIAAVHTPFIVFFTQYLNQRTLPKELRPGWLQSLLMILTGLFFAAVGFIYLLHLIGIKVF